MAPRVHDLHGRDISQQTVSMGAQREVEIFEVEKVGLIEAAELLQHLGAEQHETAADDGNLQRRNIGRQLSHGVMRQSTVLPLADEGRGKAPQEQVQQRGIAFAAVGCRAIPRIDAGTCRDNCRLGAQELQARQQAVRRERHVGVEDQMQLGLQLGQYPIVATPIAHIAVPLAQLQLDWLLRGAGLPTRNVVRQSRISVIVDQRDADRVEHTSGARAGNGLKEGFKRRAQLAGRRAVKDNRDGQREGGGHRGTTPDVRRRPTIPPDDHQTACGPAAFPAGRHRAKSGVAGSARH